MARIFLISFLATVLASFGASANIISGSQRNVLGWQLAAFDNNQGKFSHCAVSMGYANGLNMYYSMAADHRWRLAWSSQGWNLTPDQRVPISLFVDGVGLEDLTAFAINSNLAAADIPATGVVPDLIRRGHTMKAYVQGHEYELDLNGAYAALTELISCVNGFVQPTQSSEPIVNVASLSPSPKPDNSPTSQDRAEAITLAANLLLQSHLADFHILTEREVKEINLPGLDAWLVVWRSKDVIGTLRIIPKDVAASASAISTAMLADDGNSCGDGRFEYGTTLNDKSDGTIRAFTACRTNTSSWEAHYIIAPRDNGGFYLFGTSGHTLSNDVAASASNHADGLLRAAVFEVLKH